MAHGRGIPFTKVHGLGNDFVLVDAIAKPDLAALDFASLAPTWCSRHTGIGADGVLVLCRADGQGATARMRIFNSDGGEAEMCGNGVRCVARVIAERHEELLDAGGVRVQVGNGVARRVIDMRVHRDAAGRFAAAEANMGLPRLQPELIPVAAGAAVSESPTVVEVSLPGRATLRAVCVNMGNPHAVIFVERVADMAVEELGPLIERFGAFPQRTNVQFVEVVSRTHARVRTWERGAGATLACGTGACAVVVAGVLTGRTDRNAVVSLPGGDLSVRWDRETSDVWMTGPAEVVFEGVR